MAKAKKNKGVLFPTLDNEENEYADYLLGIYISELAMTTNMESTLLRKYNYRGLFELGSHTGHPTIKKLIKIGSNVACHAIVAHGYVSTRL